MHLAHATGYLKVTIASRRGRLGGGGMLERAHRIVLWAMFGPPPSHLKQPVAMHTCSKRKDCLQPLHMVWGEHKRNCSLPSKAACHAAEMLHAQQR